METQKRSADSSPLSIDNVVMAARKKFSAGPRLPGAAVALDSDADKNLIPVVPRCRFNRHVVGLSLLMNFERLVKRHFG
jgi:hypothetical protein